MNFKAVLNTLRRHEPYDQILIERNSRGGWSLRFAGDPIDQQMGNYPTSTAAVRIAAINVTRYRVITTFPKPRPQPTQTHAH